MDRKHFRHFRYPRHRHPWRRRFFTTEEKKERAIKRLEAYKEFLEKELAGVNERLAETKQVSLPKEEETEEVLVEQE